MEKIIKKAHTGGFEPDGLSPNYYNDINDSCRAITLDPLFWQALGKVCGWIKSPRMILSKLPRMIDENLETDQPELEIEEYYALRFHEENLVNGWESAVNLLSNMVNLTHEEKM